MAYPYEAGEATRFVPSAFADMKDPPTFWLRNGTPREKRHQQYVMDVEALRTHGAEEIRAELLKGMRQLFSPADYAEWSPRAKAFWEAGDSFAAEHKDTPADQVPEFVHEDEAPVREVLEQVGRDHRPYRIMVAENRRLNRTMPQIAMSLIVTRFENIEVEPRSEGRYLTLDTALEIEEALFALKPKPLPDDVPDPAQELRNECLIRMYLGKEREKNSASPSPSQPTPSDTESGKASKAGKSKASASSKKTPAAS